MNVIFTDFDGVINTFNRNLRPIEPEDAVEKRVKLLAEICHRYDCKVVIESAHKEDIDPVTLETEIDWIKRLFDLFKKYNIEVIGITPQVINEKNKDTLYPIWKEDEILKYLELHPEIDHYCVLDDDDLVTYPARDAGDFSRSDLNKVRDHLIVPLIYSEDWKKAGLQPEHVEEAGKILQKSINIRI